MASKKKRTLPALIAGLNPFKVVTTEGDAHQGSRCAATLGFETLPLWGKNKKLRAGRPGYERK
jgi:hypothetical protein